MQNFEKPVINIIALDVIDVITTSDEHDNGFVDIGDLMKSK